MLVNENKRHGALTQTKKGTQTFFIFRRSLLLSSLEVALSRTIYHTSISFYYHDERFAASLGAGAQEARGRHLGLRSGRLGGGKIRKGECKSVRSLDGQRIDRAVDAHHPSVWCTSVRCPALGGTTRCSFGLKIPPFLPLSHRILSFHNAAQMTRNGATVRARLAQLLTEGSSPNPRWLVRFQGSSLKDEEVYEHTFTGRALVEEGDGGVESRGGSNSPPSDTGSSSSRNNGGRRPAKKQKATTNSNNSNNHSDAEKADAEGGGDDAGGSQSDVSSTAAAARAREARSRRRQAMIDDGGTALSAAGRSTSNSSSNCSRKRKRTGARKTSRKGGDDEDCVKIKFLTGTLYLYKGPRRRAEFVRRV